MSKENYLKALDLLDEGKWDDAHEICQADEGTPMADWIHAHLHKEEGDLSNSGYWYRRYGTDHIDMELLEERELIRKTLKEG